jgi:hypothetical protein
MNVVLRYLLARRNDFDQVARQYFDEALREYMAKYADYDEVVGDYLPADFNAEAKYRLAHRWYRRGEHLNAAQDWPVFAEIHEKLRGSPAPLGILTGIKSLDDALGGLRGLTFLAGDKGTGKTTLALNMCLGALRNDPNLGCVFYSLDMPKERIYQRILCSVAGVDYRTLLDPAMSDSDKKKIEDVNRELLANILPRLRVLEKPQVPSASGLSKEQLVTDISGLFRSSSVGNILVIVDLFQRIDVDTSLTSDLDRDRYRLDAIIR